MHRFESFLVSHAAVFSALQRRLLRYHRYTTERPIDQPMMLHPTSQATLRSKDGVARHARGRKLRDGLENLEKLALELS